VQLLLEILELLEAGGDAGPEAAALFLRGRFSCLGWRPSRNCRGCRRIDAQLTENFSDLQDRFCLTRRDILFVIDAISASVGIANANTKPNPNMSYSNRNTGKPWTAKDNSQLKNLAAANTPTRVIGHFELGRTEDSIYSQASAKGVSLAPTNQSPYNRRKS